MDYCSISSVGKFRKNNEDFIAVYENHHCYGLDSINTEDHGKLFVLCDGMGGLRGGEVASRMACEMLINQYYSLDTGSEWGDDAAYMMSVLIKDISRRIMIYGLNNAECYGMGTTLVSLLIKGSTSYINSVGDSRLYCFRENHLNQITEDQSFVWQLYKRGIITKDEIRIHPENHLITYAVGSDTYLTAENVNRYTFDIRSEDLFILCSDGLTDMVPERVIHDILIDDNNLESIADKLESEAMDMGGRDNISIILVKI